MHKHILIIFFLDFLAVPGFAQTVKVVSDSIPFAPAVNYDVGDAPTSVFCADLDGDSALDLAVANGGSNNVAILKNHGDGTFQAKDDYGAGGDPRCVFCANLDGDSALDLAVANYSSDSVSILKNNGDGTFQTKVDYDAGNGPQSVFCADLDGDSALDLAVASNGSNTVSILINDGNGTFPTKVDYDVGSSPISVFCADLDGDTNLDIAVANEYSDNVSVLKNNGHGTFQTAVNYGVGHYPASVFCADLDGDGDLDLAVANLSSDSVSILLNQTVTDVEEDEGIDQFPQRSSLSQNYPNPFNPTTTIEFTLKKSGFVNLNIYDILGKKVRSLVSQHLSSGHRSVVWDGKNNLGKDVASGIYFYQLRVGDHSETKKLVLLK
jgi:hypothetical protein